MDSHPTKHLGRILSESELQTYRDDGVLVPRFRLPAEKLALLQLLAKKLIANNPKMGDQPMASPHVPGSGVQGLKSDPRWIEIPRLRPILDMMEQVLGPDLVLWGTTLFHKPAGTQRKVPWHRDGRYWPIKPLRTTSVWIAVTDCTVRNGCLRIIPGSHTAQVTGDHFRDHSNNVTIPESLLEHEYNERHARDVVLQPGQMVIFDVYSAHSSNANSSEKGRTGYALRFMPATCHYDHNDIPVAESPGSAHHTRPLLQVRGTDRSGKNNFTIGHP